ncbi:MAG: hypothetical protein ACR2QM_03215 [Longimicrobiales bacterium]
MNRMWRGGALIIAVGAIGQLGACGDNDPVQVTGSSCATVGPLVEILDNHLPSGGDHELVVPPADVVIGVEQTYDIRGDNTGHTHTVTLTVAHFDSLLSGDPVTVQSSNNGPVGFGHDHTINLSCP